MSNLDLEKINACIADRRNVFYWQTDRAVEPKQAGLIWADRHRYFADSELVERVNAALTDDSLEEIEPLNLDAQTNLGNVNSVRVGKLASGKEIIIRCHPKGIQNGYFHAESLAALEAVQAGLPSYNTLAVHDFERGDDFAFQVIEKLPGTAMKKWLESHPEDEERLIHEAGAMMAKLHSIQVNGFGPFDNNAAQNGELVGLHTCFSHAVRAGLDFNLKTLRKYDVLDNSQATVIDRLIAANPLLDRPEAVLVHNDFADWNLLTDGTGITGILDWDECVGGIPESDIACWSTFFNPERMPAFLEGYFSIADKTKDFDDTFELMRLRYVVSKMTLRLRRFSWDPSEAMKERIESGKLHLAESMKYFGL